MEIDVTRYERAASALDALADQLPRPTPLPLPQDRYARATASAAQYSDDVAEQAHRAALAELRHLAQSIREYSRTSVRTDDRGAARITAAG